MLNFISFLSEISRISPGSSSEKYLLAVSGGADSMVLATLFFQSKLKFEVAHINYKLRGDDSDKDQKVVEDFCVKNQIPFHLYIVSDKDNKPDGSIQLWARNLRYAFFFNVLKERNLAKIVTAHHLNDQLETFFINLSRGSGIKGLCGIPSNENQILRPLLNFSKEDIYHFAEQHTSAYREDLSNQKNDYLRNKIRNEVIPKINEEIPNFLLGFNDSVNYLKETNAFVQREIDRAFSEVNSKSSKTDFEMDKQKFLSLDSFLISEILLKLGFRGDEISKIISAENGKMFRSKTHEIFIQKNVIVCKYRHSQ